MPLSDFFSISLTDIPGLAGAGYLLWSWWRRRSCELRVSVVRQDGTGEHGEPTDIHRIRFESRGVSVSPSDFLSRVEIWPPVYEDVESYIGYSVAGEYPLPPLEADIARKLRIDSVDKLLSLEPFALEPGEAFEVILTTPRGTRPTRPLRVDLRLRASIPVRRYA